MQGRQILHYTIGEKLGEGGMGEVYLAHDSKLDRSVAIKFIPPSLQQSPEARVRLLREAQAASRLVHPNIVAIHAIEKADGQDFIVMEYVQGRPLSDVIAANTLTLDQVLDLARQIADALAVAHEVGVVHRDIKSSNILVTERGQAKILDFGLATYYGATQVTDAGSTMGTASYMSPEQTQGRPIDHRSDLFSFGVVLYEMITGRRPFEGENRNAVAYAICNTIPEPLARFKVGVPAALEGIVAKALRKDPTERYQSAADMMADIKVAMRESDRGSHQPYAGQPPTPPQPYYGVPQTPHTPPYPQSPTTPPYAPYPGQTATPVTPHAPYPGQPATPHAPYPAHTPTPSAPYPPSSGMHTPSQPMPPYTPPSKPRSNVVAIVAIVVIGIVVMTAILAPRIGKGPSGPPATSPPTVATPQEPASAGEHRVKIAVLPFENEGTAQDEYFADGITEEITARLASLGELGVLARTSVAGYKGSKKPVRDIGRELGVDYVLEGTVRWQRGEGEINRVRVTPTLVRVGDGTNVWAHVYDEPMTAVFKVQSNIAKTVAQELDVTLNEPERAALETALTANMEAYDAYLKGMRLKDQWSSAPDMRVAISQFEKAAALDPDFLMAFVRISEVNADMVWFTLDQSDQRVDASRRAAERAIQIAPNSPDARWAMGWYYYHGRRDLKNAMHYLEPVLEERPNSPDARAAVAYVQRRQGRFEEALANLLRAYELNPNDATLAFSVGETQGLLGEYPKARQFFDRSIELGPELTYARTEKVISFVLEGDLLNARREAQSLVDVFGYEERGNVLCWVDYLLRDYDAYFEASAKSGPRDDNEGYRPMELWDALVYRSMNNAAAARSSFTAARDHLEVKLKENPDDFRVHGALGIAYAGLGDKTKAMLHADRAMEILPPSQDALRAHGRRTELAYTLILLGDYDAAIDQLEMAISAPGLVTIPLLRKDPMCDSLRDRPRFQALIGSS